MPAFNPNIPVNNTTNDADPIRNNFNALKTLIDAGIPGPQGIPGTPGAQGPQGPQGNPGTGLVFVGNWNPLTTYTPGQTVNWNANLFVATTTIPPGNDPINGPPWSVITLNGPQGVQGIPGPPGEAGIGLTFQGAWNIISYAQGDAVIYNNTLYVALTAITTTNTPDTNPDWQAITFPVNETAKNPAALMPLNLTVSNPPTQAEVQLIANQLDLLLAALQR